MENILGEHHPYGYAIDVEDGTKRLFGPICNLSQDELNVFREYIDENLAKKLFNSPYHRLKPLYSLSKKGWFITIVDRLLSTQQNYYQKSISTIIDIAIFGLTRTS